MKRILLSALFFCLMFFQIARAQTTAFTYQGSLQSGGTAASGNFDFEFALFDAASGGTQFGSTISINSVVVSNGVFSVPLNFGNVFPGALRFLEIRVRTAGGGSFTVLNPRQQIDSVPYTIMSLNAANANFANNATNATQLGGITSSGFIRNQTTQQSSSNFNISGNGIIGGNGTISGNGTINGNLTVGGSGSADIFNATTQFNLGGNRFLFGSNNNTFAGLRTGLSNTGDFNSFFGTDAGRLNTSGNQNSFFGNDAGTNNTSGNFNTFIGEGAGRGTTTGSENSFFGVAAGFGNLTGNRLTLIGLVAGVLNDNLTNASAIGYRAAVSQSNSIVLGSISGINQANADTNVGIGTTAPLKRLHIRGFGDQEIMLESADSGGTKWTLQSSDGASGGRFEIINRTINASRFTILPTGNVGIGTTAPNDRLDVNGTIGVATLGTAGLISLCRNANNQISTCSSSIRYKTNVNPFNGGLDLIRRLRPVSFIWKANGMADFGLVAEEVAAVEPLLTTTNEKDEIEGVKYDRIGVVLINAVGEQQAQIESLEKKIDEQKEIIRRQNELFQKQQTTLDALKKLVCSSNPTAEICQPEK